MTDKQLYSLCKKYGRRAVLWRRKFLGLLPEVDKRGLYEKKGFSSVFEFAAKLAGVSHDQVRQVLGLEKRLEQNAPKLHAMLINGQVSANKLIRVASIATTENQEILANYVQQLSKSALETLVRDEKQAEIQSNMPAELQVAYERISVSIRNESRPNFSNQDAFYKPKNDQKVLPGQQPNAELKISPEVHNKLLELQRKGIDINALLTEFLEKREAEIKQEKEKIAAHIKDVPASSRYIPVETKRLLQKEHGTKCAAPYCSRNAEEIHHTNRFALSKRHDPRFLAPLCSNHHRIAHAIDTKYNEQKKAVMLS